MPTSVGPNTFGEENLVFGYDTGDTVNSYKGEPTTNHAVSIIDGGSTAVADVQATLPDKSVGTVKQVTVSGVGTFRRVYLTYSGLPNSGIPQNGQQFTVSHWIRRVGGVRVGAGWEPELSVGDGYQRPTAESGYSGDTTATQPQEVSTEWQYVTYTYSWNADKTTPQVVFLYFGGPPGVSGADGGIVQIYNPQLEIKSHATPFVNGTRSATQGLIDLTGNSTIDLTNVSFDSNAQMTFDGTDEYVSVAYNTALNTPNGATYEVMLYPESGGEFLSRGKSDSGTDPDNPRFYIDGSGYLYFDWSTTGADTYVVTPGSTATFNQWQHVVGVAQPGDQLRIYVNGVEASYNSVVRTVPSLVPNTEDPLIIGGVSWIPRYFEGKIGMVKLYNRALIASEIKANYNAIKGRFNI